MRGGIAHHSLIIAIALCAAACGGKDKGDKQAADGTTNGSAVGTEGAPADDGEAKAAALQQKIKAFNDQNGGCEECQPTEARVRVEAQVPAGLRTYSANPSCMNEARETAQIREVADDAAAFSDGEFAGAVGELLKSPEVKRAIGKKVGGDVGRILNGGDDRTAYCQAVCAVLPQNSTVTGYKLEAAAASDGQFQACQAGQDCAIGKAKWTAEPIPNSGENSKTVCGVFANWATKSARKARLSVYFTPPQDWVPPR